MRTAREVLPMLYMQVVDIYVGAIDGAVVGALLGPYVDGALLGAYVSPALDGANVLGD